MRAPRRAKARGRGRVRIRAAAAVRLPYRFRPDPALTDPQLGGAAARIVLHDYRPEVLWRVARLSDLPRGPTAEVAWLPRSRRAGSGSRTPASPEPR